MRTRMIGIALITCFIQLAHADTGCKATLTTTVCSPPQGSIIQTSFGGYVCGLGQCVETSFGQVVCSSQPGGYVIVSQLGHIKCSGGCENARATLCQIPK